MAEDYSDLAQAPSKEDYSDLAISPSNHEGFLQNAIKNTPGIVGELAKPYAPSEMRIGGQMAGGMFGGYPGAVAGETLGDIGAQGLQSLESGENKFNIGDIAKNSAITGVTEGLGRGVGKLFMGSAPERSLIKEGLGKIGEIKSSLGELGDVNPDLSIPKDDVLNNLQSEFSKTKNPMGPGATVFNKWIDYLSNPEITHIDPNTAMQMENEFGRASVYSNPKTFWDKLFYNMNNPIKQPYLNEGVKNVRNGISDIVNNMADQIGRPDFGDLSQKFSEAKYNLSGSGESSGMLGNVLKGVKGVADIGSFGGLGALLGHPVVGAGMGIADIIRRSPVIQDLLYNTLGKTGIGTGVTTGLSEIARKGTGS